MDSWSYQGGATSAEDYSARSWNTDVGNLFDSRGAVITFTPTDDADFEVEIRPQAGSDITCGTATYFPESGAVHGSFLNETGQPMMLVASLARFTNDADPDQEDWHLYALLVIDDPNDAAVMGAQGGG